MVPVPLSPLQLKQFEADVIQVEHLKLHYKQVLPDKYSPLAHVVQVVDVPEHFKQGLPQG